MKINNSQIDYDGEDINQADLSANPLHVFKEWFLKAQQEDNFANAMVLSTVSLLQQPSSRVVLLKSFDYRGFVFFTNLESQKAEDIAYLSRVSLLFFWPTQIRQVRIQGEARKVSRKEAEEYFATRPLGSQISAWQSPQSRHIREEAIHKLREKPVSDPSQCPPFWGGYRIKPSQYEFFQGKKDRWHDRILYLRSPGLGKYGWRSTRVAP
ncbi:MAG: pyridoxamine 5'-phosphate oxidase [Cytophagales bacterium]|nr:pyridoxamine 5'-phosphate oxidase [Cytophagales bacterium]